MTYEQLLEHAGRFKRGQISDIEWLVIVNEYVDGLVAVEVAAGRQTNDGRYQRWAA